MSGLDNVPDTILQTPICAEGTVLKVREGGAVLTLVMLNLDTVPPWSHTVRALVLAVECQGS